MFFEIIIRIPFCSEKRLAFLVSLSPLPSISPALLAIAECKSVTFFLSFQVMW